MEPFDAYCIGRWFRICEEATPENLEHECHSFWYGVNALNKLSIPTNKALCSGGGCACRYTVNHEGEFTMSERRFPTYYPEAHEQRISSAFRLWLLTNRPAYEALVSGTVEPRALAEVNENG